MSIIKKFKDGSFLEYDQGRFDEWCVYLKLPNGKRYPPHDTDYFQTIIDFATKYGRDRVYADYVSIYDITGKKVEEQVLKQITQISSSYDYEDRLKVDLLFTILYMAMIAEECKKNTQLGRRIKRLGIFNLLYEGMDVDAAANFMRGMRWPEIDQLCETKGF